MRKPRTGERPVLDWETVIKTHRDIAGVHIKDGFVRSLLVSNKPDSRYKHQVNDDAVDYAFPADYPGKWDEAMIANRKEDVRIRVFCKKATNQWLDFGELVVGRREQRGDTVYYKLDREVG